MAIQSLEMFFEGQLRQSRGKVLETCWWSGGAWEFWAVFSHLVLREAGYGMRAGKLFEMVCDGFWGWLRQSGKEKLRHTLMVRGGLEAFG